MIFSENIEKQLKSLYNSTLATNYYSYRLLTFFATSSIDLGLLLLYRLIASYPVFAWIYKILSVSGFALYSMISLLLLMRFNGKNPKLETIRLRAYLLLLLSDLCIIWIRSWTSISITVYMSYYSSKEGIKMIFARVCGNPFSYD